jgi:dTDP-4-amino-4,6-dideoxygalactose transaminase
MKITPFGLDNQFKNLGLEVLSVIQEVLESGTYVLGEKVKKFEGEFASYCGTKHGVGVNSGTDALMLALKAIGVKEGDEVITAPNSFIATASTIVLCGAKPVFADIDPETYNIDPEKIRKIIKRSKGKIRAILPVHLYGHPTDMDPIVEVAEEHGMYVIEDACQAHGAMYKAKKTGALGHIGCFSFYPTKNLGAYGDGGMLVMNDDELAQKVRLLRDYGRDARYTHTIIGYNSRLDEIQAAVLSVKLRHLDGWVEKRRKNATIYRELLSAVPKIVIPVEKDYAKQAYWLYVIRIRHREKLQDALAKKGVETVIVYPVPIHLQKTFSYLGLGEGNFPIAEKCSKEILSLPVYPELREEQIQYITQIIKGNV